MASVALPEKLFLAQRRKETLWKRGSALRLCVFARENHSRNRYFSGKAGESLSFGHCCYSLNLDPIDDHFRYRTVDGDSRFYGCQHRELVQKLCKNV